MKKNVLKHLVWILEGIIVGFGAIMPGISGGTLCVAFGMYLPIIGIISSPFANLKKYGKMLFFFAIGIFIGFVGLSGLAGYLMELSSVLVTCAFIGFIIGTFPELLEDAGAKGRTKLSYISILIGFLSMLGILTLIRSSGMVNVSTSFWGFLLCGIFWGISFIVPGLSSSTLLLFFGLYQPMLDGIAHLDFAVLIPMMIGAGACVILLSKGVNLLFDRFFNPLSHLIIGFVAATVVMIIPEGGSTASELIPRIICIIGGAAVSYALSRLCAKIKNDNE